MKKEISIFIDESGKFGDFKSRTDFYAISFVFHEQDKNIKSDLSRLNEQIEHLGFTKKLHIHTGPIIRREDAFKTISGSIRRSLFASLFTFFRRADISFKCFVVDRKYVSNIDDVLKNFSENINNFFLENSKYFSKFRKIKIYYDGGQKEVSRIIRSVLPNELLNIEFKDNVSPVKYRLLQVADLVCTLSVIEKKMKNNKLTKSEINFFVDRRHLQRDYLRPMRKKEF